MSASPSSATVGQPTDRYLSLRMLAGYAGLSVRRLRDFLVHESTPLPHYRIGGKILVHSQYDAWVARFRNSASPMRPDIMESVFRDL